MCVMFWAEKQKGWISHNGSTCPVPRRLMCWRKESVYYWTLCLLPRKTSFPNRCSIGFDVGDNDLLTDGQMPPVYASEWATYSNKRQTKDKRRHGRPDASGTRLWVGYLFQQKTNDNKRLLLLESQPVILTVGKEQRMSNADKRLLRCSRWQEMESCWWVGCGGYGPDDAGWKMVPIGAPVDNRPMAADDPLTPQR